MADPYSPRLYTQNIVRAQRGDKEAQYWVGVCYRDGNGVDREPSQTVHWWKLAAAQASGKARFRLGNCYSYGIIGGVAEEYREQEQARLWLQAIPEMEYEAETNDDRESMLLLAFALRHGQGTDRDAHRSIEYFRRAAERGHPEAQHQLAVSYKHGTDGVTRDWAMALFWCQKAIVNGCGNEAHQNMNGLLRLILPRRDRLFAALRQSIRVLSKPSSNGGIHHQHNFSAVWNLVLATLASQQKPVGLSPMFLFLQYIAPHLAVYLEDNHAMQLMKK